MSHMLWALSGAARNDLKHDVLQRGELECAFLAAAVAAFSTPST